MAKVVEPNVRANIKQRSKKLHYSYSARNSHVPCSSASTDSAILSGSAAPEGTGAPSPLVANELESEKEVWLLRHGLSSFNLEDKIQGSLINRSKEFSLVS